MKAAFTTFSLSRFSFFSLNSLTRLLAPLRRASARPAAGVAARASIAAEPIAPAAAPRMDAATYAAMLAEAERIAAPYRRHIAKLAALPPAEEQDADADFSDVEALLARAGLLAD